MPRQRTAPAGRAQKKKDKILTVASAIEKAFLSGKAPVDIHDLASEWMNICEGPKGFARMMFDEINALPVGSAGRVRLMDIGARLCSIATSPVSGGDLSLLTEEDLERAVANTMVRMGVQTPDQAATERRVVSLEKRLVGMVPAVLEWIDHVCI